MERSPGGHGGHFDENFLNNCHIHADPRLGLPLNYKSLHPHPHLFTSALVNNSVTPFSAVGVGVGMDSSYCRYCSGTDPGPRPGQKEKMRPPTKSSPDLGPGFGSGSGPLDPEQCPDSLVQFVLPALEGLYWIFIIPSRFRFDPETCRHVRVDGGFLRKAVVLLLQASSVAFLWNNVNRLTSSEELKNSRIGIIYHVMYICFAFLTVTYYWTLWSHRECINILLARIEVLALELLKDRSCRLPKRRHVKYPVWALLGLCVFYTLAYTVLFEITHGNFDDLVTPTRFLSTLVHEAELNLYYGTGLIPLTNRTTPARLQGHSLGPALVIGVAYFIIVLYETATWFSSFIMMLLWGLLFRKLFQTYFEIMGKHQACHRFKLRYVRVFQKITMLIEDYNRIFGLNILFSIVSCTLFLSLNAWNAFTSFGTNLGVNALVAGACLFFGAILLVCSEVNNMANQMSMSIKTFYQHERMWRLNLKGVNLECVDGTGPPELNIPVIATVTDVDSFIRCSEVTQGLGMIQHDLQSNAIGFKGYGFFTISYSFIGTVISILITYSIMFAQWRGTSGL